MAKLNEYLTVGEAAGLLGGGKDTLRRWDRAGKLKARRYPISRFRLFRKADLDAFLARIGPDATSRKAVAERKRAGRRQ